MLKIAFFNRPALAKGAWASCGKKIAENPGGIASRVCGTSSLNWMSRCSSNAAVGP